MKTIRIHALLLGLIATLVIISCKKTDVKNEDAEIVSARSVISVSSPPTNEPADCNTACIDPGGPYIESIGSKTQTWGNTNNPHWKTISHAAYNTPTSLVVKVTFEHSGGNASNTVSVTAFGSTQSVLTLASGATATFTFALPGDWKACDNVPFSVYQEGLNSPMNLSCSYDLYGICANKGCETSFEGQAILCGTEREAEFTFTSKDAIDGFKIQGGLTNFTGADAIVTVTGGDNISQSQVTVGGSSNRVITVEGNIGACETIKIHITWHSTNSGGIITGSWSISGNGGEVAPSVAGLTCGN